MWRLPTLVRPAAELIALEANAERAGAALACPFSSSAEMEAAIVRARRAAGVYGPKRHRRSILILSATALIMALALGFVWVA